MDRRSFLKHTGVMTVMLAAGEVWRSFGEELPEFGDGAAFEPWKTWKQDAKEGPLSLVRAAILSANAYNSQPWLFRLTASRIEIYADLKRNLGAFDPYLREMYFSLGCALENLLIAAAAEGYQASAKLEPGSLLQVHALTKPALVSSIKLKQGKAARSELYAVIPHRHTNREPFDAGRPVPAAFVGELETSVHDQPSVRMFTFTGKEEINKIVEVVASASGKFLGDAEVRRGVQPWIRTTSAQIQQFRDGALIDARASRNGTLEAYASLMRTGRLFGIIAVRDRYNRAQTLCAGRIWQRAHLLATARGLAARPANGTVELIDHQRQRNERPEAAASLTEFTHDAAWEPTFMFYMGYATVPAPASARRAVQDVEL